MMGIIDLTMQCSSITLPPTPTLLSSPVRNNALDMKKMVCRGFRKITTYLLYTVSLTFCSVKVINYGKKKSCYYFNNHMAIMTAYCSSCLEYFVTDHQPNLCAKKALVY